MLSILSGTRRSREDHEFPWSVGPTIIGLAFSFLLLGCGEANSPSLEQRSAVPGKTGTQRTYSRAEEADVFGRGGMATVDSVVVRKTTWEEYLDGGGRVFAADAAGVKPMAKVASSDEQIAAYSTIVYVVLSRGRYVPVGVPDGGFDYSWRLLVIHPELGLPLVTIAQPGADPPAFVDRLPDRP